MSKHFDRFLKKRDNAIMRIDDAYSIARTFGQTHSELMESIAKVNSTLMKCPQWVWAYCEGYRQALNNGLYRESLVYGGMVDGVFMSTHSNRADYYQNHGIAPSEFAKHGRVKQTGHYWNPDLFQGKVKPFFISEESA